MELQSYLKGKVSDWPKLNRRIAISLEVKLENESYLLVLDFTISRRESSMVIFFYFMWHRGVM